MSSDEKKCPYCGEMVKKSATKCKHCGEWLDASKRDASERINVVVNNTGSNVEPEDDGGCLGCMANIIWWIVAAMVIIFVLLCIFV